jgi:hypothetical protein
MRPCSASPWAAGLPRSERTLKQTKSACIRGRGRLCRLQLLPACSRSNRAVPGPAAGESRRQRREMREKPPTQGRSPRPPAGTRALAASGVQRPRLRMRCSWVPAATKMRRHARCVRSTLKKVNPAWRAKSATVDSTSAASTRGCCVPRPAHAVGQKSPLCSRQDQHSDFFCCCCGEGGRDKNRYSVREERERERERFYSAREGRMRTQ